MVEMEGKEDTEGQEGMVDLAEMELLPHYILQPEMARMEKTVAMVVMEAKVAMAGMAVTLKYASSLKISTF
jgi:hypothetical protein